MHRPRNIIGPQLRALRVARDWTQQTMVARLNLAGWDISRETLAKIESQIRWVADFELVMIAEALAVDISGLLPPRETRPKILGKALP